MQFSKIKPVLGWLAVVFLGGLVNQKIIPPEVGVILAGAIRTWLPMLGAKDGAPCDLEEVTPDMIEDVVTPPASPRAKQQHRGVR